MLLRARTARNATPPGSAVGVSGAPADGKKPERVRIQIKPKKKPTQ